MADKGTILIVDDDNEILVSLCQLLEGSFPAASILAAGSGKQALALLANQTPQVIIADFRMPEMDGIEFLKQTIKVAPKATRILMSAYAAPEVAAKATRESGAAFLMTKPFPLDQFVRLIGTLLEKPGP